jgi:L-threonylcarbamoyladenylate synthase
MRDVSLDDAIHELRAGRLLAFPTETVYGLGADGLQPDAVRAIFEVKGRPPNHPLILHIASAAELDGYVREVPPAARRLADLLWPGPLTLVLKRGDRVPLEVTGGLDTVGLRVPAHPLALALLRGLRSPIAAPSANRFGRVSPTTAEHVRADLADTHIALLDGGPSLVGIESTIVDCSTGAPTVLRRGGITREVLDDVLGAPITEATEPGVRAPGMHPSHYAPRATVIALSAGEIDGFVKATQPPYTLVARRAPPLPEGARFVEMPAEAVGLARRLYALLRELDASGTSLIAMEAPPHEGLGWAIADRLARAAAPR